MTSGSTGCVRRSNKALGRVWMPLSHVEDSVGRFQPFLINACPSIAYMRVCDLPGQQPPDYRWNLNQNHIMFTLIGGLIGLVWFLITLGVAYNIVVKSNQSGTFKLLWIVGILLFPFLGPLAWILFGERTS